MSGRLETSPSPTMMAPTGQASSHRPRPMHFLAWMSVETPPTRPRAPSSWQALMQLPQPTQMSCWIVGNWAIALSAPRAFASRRCARFSRSASRSKRLCHHPTMKKVTASTLTTTYAFNSIDYSPA